MNEWSDRDLYARDDADDIRAHNYGTRGTSMDEHIDRWMTLVVWSLEKESIY